MPGRQAYGEICSASSCTDYQARRLGTRLKRARGGAGKDATVYLHTVNGTGIALPRVMLTLLESGVQDDGSIALPEVLHRYLPFESIPAPQ